VALVPASGNALYYAADTLGSSRVIVQSNGTLCYDADFTPFGGEMTQTSTCAQNYKFEGKERDTETGNDDFGARYYSWRFGRWLSSDWSAVPVPVPYANLTNPQTLNLYSMVADDPESFADLDGHLINGADVAMNMSLRGESSTNGTLEAQALSASMSNDPFPDPQQKQGKPAQNKCGFWCKVGQALGFVETDKEKQAAAGQRGWIKRNVRTADGKQLDIDKKSDRQVTNLYNMIMMGMMMGRIPIAGSSGPGAPEYQTDPAQSPGPGWEWRGKGPLGSSEGSWYNPGTNESFHPDLSHPDPIGPHYDYRDALGNDYRVFPDGTVVPK